MTHIPQSRRVPKGAARPRIQVALPEEILKSFLIDARNNMRSLSAQAALIIREHYAAQESGIRDQESAGAKRLETKQSSVLRPLSSGA
ncbi:hypothetical protein AGMMS50256_33970 [Betaproteobacteria bacterium]|nr:hypothetical protein AGMMS50256_33970 [Betaproteobacteria bacterium]